MPTYRCRACLEIYVAPPSTAAQLLHVCPPVLDQASGRLVRHPEARDENIVQDPETGTVTIRAAGLGRDLIDEGDALTGATPDEIKVLRYAPAIGPSPQPEVPPRSALVWPSRGTNW